MLKQRETEGNGIGGFIGEFLVIDEGAGSKTEARGTLGMREKETLRHKVVWAKHLKI